MKSLTLARCFALVALDVQDSGRMTVAKRAALRGVAAAAVAELLSEGGQADKPLPVTGSEAQTLYQQTVLEELGGKGGKSATELILSVTQLRDKQLRTIERAMVDSLMGEKLLDIVGSLMNCDMYIVEAGITHMEYRADAAAYRGITMQLRDEVLGQGNMTDGAAMLLWLLRECGVLADLFSDKEWTAVGQRMLEVCRAGGVCATLMPLAIHRALEHSIGGLLHAKTKLVATDVGTGLNFVCPILERAESVFIEMDGIGDEWPKRAEVLAERLQKLNGRSVTFEHVGKVCKVRVDNVLYEAVPAGVQVGGGGIRVPVYGVRLRRYPAFQ